MGVAVAAGGGVVVGFGGAAVGVGDVVGGAGEAVELFGCHSVRGGAWFFWCGEEWCHVGPLCGLLVCAGAGDSCGGDLDGPCVRGGGEGGGDVGGVAFADGFDGVCQVFGDVAGGQVDLWPCAGYSVRRVDDGGGAVRRGGVGYVVSWFDEAAGECRLIGAGVERCHSE